MPTCNISYDVLTENVIDFNVTVILQYFLLLCDKIVILKWLF